VKTASHHNAFLGDGKCRHCEKIGSSGGFNLAAAPGKITGCDAASFERPGIR
jgi:hypothetical protein